MKRPRVAIGVAASLLALLLAHASHLPFENRAEASESAPRERRESFPPSHASAKLPPDLRSLIDTNRDPARTHDVLVQFDAAPSASSRALVERHGGLVRHRFQSIDALLVRVPLARVEALASEASVVFVTPDRKVRGTLAAAARLVGADKLWRSSSDNEGPGGDDGGRSGDDGDDDDDKYDGVDGHDIGIAVIDSGVSPGHRDLKDRIVAFKDFIGDSAGRIKSGTSGGDSYDDYGHGTAVAGAAAGDGDGSRQRDSNNVKWYPGNYGDFKGIAPDAKIVAVKAIDSNGLSHVSTVVQAIDYVISVRAKHSIRVLRCS